MYVCICHAVTEDDILDAVDAGASCARTICKETMAGSSCGTCFRRVQGVAAVALQRRESRSAAAQSPSPRPSLRVVS